MDDGLTQLSNDSWIYFERFGRLWTERINLTFEQFLNLFNFERDLVWFYGQVNSTFERFLNLLRTIWSFAYKVLTFEQFLNLWT